MKGISFKIAESHFSERGELIWRMKHRIFPVWWNVAP